MKKDMFNGKLSGRSTAAVVAFCLAAVAALGIFAYNRSADELRSELSGISDGTVKPEPAAVTEEPAAEAEAPAEVPFTEANLPREDIILEQDGLSGDDAPAEEMPVTHDITTDAVVRPVNGDIVNAYSDGELVKSRTLNVWKTHDGIDISADAGTSVRSVAGGTVTEVMRDAMMGVTIIIDHGSGYEGYYCNLAGEAQVSEGDTVSAGTVIGEVGNTAEAEIAEESHLHFGLMKNGSWTDPAEFLSGEGS